MTKAFTFSESTNGHINQSNDSEDNLCSIENDCSAGNSHESINNTETDSVPESHTSLCKDSIIINSIIATNQRAQANGYSNENSNSNNSFLLPYSNNGAEKSTLKVDTDDSALDDADSGSAHQLGTATFSGRHRVGRWTLDEKILFLYGLQKFGKGRWKKISFYVPERYVEYLLKLRLEVFPFALCFLFDILILFSHFFPLSYS